MDPFQIVAGQVDSAVHAVGAAKVANAIPELERVHKGTKVKPTATNAIGQTFLHVAIASAAWGGSNAMAVVDFYRNEGVDINAKDSAGRTALHYAAMYGKLYLVQELLRRGADPTLTSKSGDTALREAVTKGHEAVARLLNTKGSPVNPKWMGDPSPLAQALVPDKDLGSRAHPLPEETYTMSPRFNERDREMATRLEKGEPTQYSRPPPEALANTRGTSALFPRLTGVGRKTRKHGHTRVRRRARGRLSRRKTKA